MEGFASDIARYLPNPSSLRLVSSQSRESILLNDSAILSGIKRKYPSSGTIEGAIIEAIENNDIQLIKILLNEYTDIQPIPLDNLAMYIDSVPMANILLPHLPVPSALVLVSRLNLHGYNPKRIDILIKHMSILDEWINTSVTGNESRGYASNIVTLIMDVLRYNYTSIPANIIQSPFILESMRTEIAQNEMRRMSPDPWAVGYKEPPILPLDTNTYRLRILGLKDYVDVLLADNLLPPSLIHQGAYPIDHIGEMDVIRYDDINIFKAMKNTFQVEEYSPIFLYTKYNRVIDAILNQGYITTKDIEREEPNERYIYLIVRYSNNPHLKIYALARAVEEGYIPILARYMNSKNIIPVLSRVGREYDPQVRELFKVMGLKPSLFDPVFEGTDKNDLWIPVLLNTIIYGPEPAIQYMIGLYKSRITPEILQDIIYTFMQQRSDLLPNFIQSLPLSIMNQKTANLLNTYIQERNTST